MNSNQGSTSHDISKEEYFLKGLPNQKLCRLSFCINARRFLSREIVSYDCLLVLLSWGWPSSAFYYVFIHRIRFRRTWVQTWFSFWWPDRHHYRQQQLSMWKIKDVEKMYSVCVHLNPLTDDKEKPSLSNVGTWFLIAEMLKCFFDNEIFSVLDWPWWQARCDIKHLFTTTYATWINALKLERPLMLHNQNKPFELKILQFMEGRTVHTYSIYIGNNNFIIIGNNNNFFSILLCVPLSSSSSSLPNIINDFLWVFFALESD